MPRGAVPCTRERSAPSRRAREEDGTVGLQRARIEARVVQHAPQLVGLEEPDAAGREETLQAPSARGPGAQDAHDGDPAPPPGGAAGGPPRLVFDIATEAGDKAGEFHLSLSPFTQVIKDYFQICESYFNAVKRLPPDPRVTQAELQDPLQILNLRRLPLGVRGRENCI
jgi:hypothetical protein